MLPKAIQHPQCRWFPSFFEACQMNFRDLNTDLGPSWAANWSAWQSTQVREPIKVAHMNLQVESRVMDTGHTVSHRVIPSGVAKWPLQSCPSKLDSCVCLNPSGHGDMGIHGRNDTIYCSRLRMPSNRMIYIYIFFLQLRFSRFLNKKGVIHNPDWRNSNEVHDDVFLFATIHLSDVHDDYFSN